MSDFLSNFSGDDYKKNLPKKRKKINEEKEVTGKDNSNESLEETSRKKRKRKRITKQVSSEEITEFDNPNLLDTPEEDFPIFSPLDMEENNYDSDDLHDVEIDPDYQKKQRNKKMAGIVAGIVIVALGYTFYYQMTHVKLPNFVNKSVTDVKKWATENRMELGLKEAYSLEIETSNVIKQGTSEGKSIKKGTTLDFTISEGPDPEEVISLPDFKDMTEMQVEEFVEENKAENVSIINEYSDKAEKGQFVRVEFSDKEVTSENYRRRDSVNVYFSRGKEVFEKNITVPDFTGKLKTEVEEWAKKNEISMTYEEAASDKIEDGKIISQNIEKNQKIAKKDKMTVTVSLGKAVVVPNYANYSAESSLTATEGMEVQVQQVFSDNVAYGELISQSIESGKNLTGKDSKSIKLVYSYGRPYIKSYYGQLEGDIPKLIYDDLNSKGANVTYGVYYIDSEAEKGEIVQMGLYNQYIASDSYISFGISNGRYATQPGKKDTNTELAE